ncbi:sulfotransferase family 2 domain-containing protein [Vibrio sp. CB1-14]|uniref:Sulfotransferase family 2 domain-containing protein n=1 Tax=Vibrio chaetopteri TaxID=3016528 RepID=A0AAU8BI85_9VIBR
MIRKIVRNIIPIQFRSMIQRLRGRSVYHDYYLMHRCIFIHIPKSAGQSISLALFNDKHPGHYSIKKFEWESPKKKEAYFKFTVVRNPWDRLYSAYNYLTKFTPYKSDQEFSEKYLSEYKSFEDFILNGLKKKEISSWVHFRPQSDFLLDSKGNFDIDYVARFENIEDGFLDIAKRLDVDVPKLQKVNSSNRDSKSYKKHYSQDTIRIVAKHYENDIKLLNYEF